MSKGIVRSGDILLVKDGATTGRVAFIESATDPGYAVNEHVFILRTDQSIANSLFIFYALFSPIGQKAILNSFHGAAQGGITQDFARSVWIPIPTTLPEQERIVTQLQEQIVKALHIRQINEKQLKAVNSLRQSIVNQEMAKVGTSRGYIINSLRSRPVSGWPHAYGNESHGVPFLTLTAVFNFRYDGTKIKYTDQTVNENDDYWAQPGDIFMSRSNTPELVGQAAIYDGIPIRVIFPDLLIRLQPDPSKADIRFVHYWLMSRTARQYITSNARGSSGTMKKITLEMVREIPFPSHLELTQQNVIANNIDQKMALSKKVIAAVDKQVEAATALSNSLLMKVFGGFIPPHKD
jgi:type I restriction enzyme, S subunit